MSGVTYQQAADAMDSLGYQKLYDHDFAMHHGIQEWGLRTRVVVGEEIVGFSLRSVMGGWELDRDSYTVGNDQRFPGRKSNARTETQIKNNLLDLFDTQVSSAMLAGAYAEVLHAEFMMIRQRLTQLQPRPANCNSES